jgi:predicted MFS family arabinose efflux permease
MAWQMVPQPNANTPAHKLDFVGAVLLSISLGCLLLAISQGEIWGWGSLRVLVLLASAFVAGVAWTRYELSVDHPLVELRLISRPTVLAANLAALLMGMALYGMSSLVNRYLQTPASAGYGFDSSLVTVGLTLLPLSFGSVAASRISTPLTTRFGPGKVVAGGALLVGLDMAWLSVMRAERWDFALGILILGIGVGLTFAMMPALIIRSVPMHETGSATGLNQVLRLVGGSIGSAASIAILGRHHLAGGRIPTEGGYTTAFLAGAVACALAAGICLMLIREKPALGGAPARTGRRDSVPPSMHAERTS